jgi:histidinol phosphatase-like enzyme
MHPALFLDRDGVIIENRPDYVRSWSDVMILPKPWMRCPGSNRAVQIIIVTNQSAVGRGLILSDARKLTPVLSLKSNVQVDG